MYPFPRVIVEMARARRAPRLPLTGEHVSHHRCLPGDLDLAWELNNGRTLTMMDLGRMPLFERTGLFRRVYAAGLFMTMAGVTVRYRRRVRLWDRVTLRSRILCWDARFFYLEQAMIRADGEAANHALYRVAVAGPQGIVAPQQAAALVGWSDPSPPMPDWIAAWVAAEAARPWPPMQD